MYNQTFYQPAYGPQGQPFCCRVTLGHGTTEAWYFTEREAWDAKDRLNEQGFTARVIGAPLRVAGGLR